MASHYRIERDRGTKESRQQLAVLRAKWPRAFPVNGQDVRPLAIGTPPREIAAVMGWSHPFTLGVLAGWKMAPVYCRAVLCYEQRIALDGDPAEVVVVYNPPELARAGVFVSIDSDGDLRIERGFVRPEDERPADPGMSRPE